MSGPLFLLLTLAFFAGVFATWWALREWMTRLRIRRQMNARLKAWARWRRQVGDGDPNT